MEQSSYRHPHPVSFIPPTTPFVQIQPFAISRVSQYFLQRSDGLLIVRDSSYMTSVVPLPHIGRQQPMFGWQIQLPHDMIPTLYETNYGYAAPPPAPQAYIRPWRRCANRPPRQQRASQYPFGPANVVPPQPSDEPEVLILDELPQELEIAAEHVIKTLPFAILSPDDKKAGCVVCMDGFGAENKISKLPCGHFFHSNCILLWLNINNTCPLCRFKLCAD